MKKIIVGVLILVVVVAGVLVFGLSKLGPLVKTAVNTYGPDITKTEVRLGDVDVSLFSAQAKLKNFYLGNPKGFNAPDAIQVGSILVDVDEGSLTGDTIVIERIEVLSPQLTYEKTAKSDNFQTILSNIRKGQPSGGTASNGGNASTGGPGKKLIIKDFLLKGGKVNLAASLLGQNQSVSADLPDIHLTGIGEKKGGLSPDAAIKAIFDAINKQINSPDVMSAFSTHLKGLNLDTSNIEKSVQKELEGAQKGIEGVQKEMQKGIEGKIKGILGN